MPLYPRPLPGLRETRRKRRWSQQRLASKAGLSLSAVARLEQGATEARAITVVQLARALGVPPEQLTGGVGVPVTVVPPPPADDDEPQEAAS